MTISTNNPARLIAKINCGYEFDRLHVDSAKSFLSVVIEIVKGDGFGHFGFLAEGGCGEFGNHVGVEIF